MVTTALPDSARDTNTQGQIDATAGVDHDKSNVRGINAAFMSDKSSLGLQSGYYESHRRRLSNSQIAHNKKATVPTPLIQSSRTII